jgi:choline-glycine betaine transporter
MFIARISRGRTIRQFVSGVLLVPSAVSLLWFAIFGGSAIGLQEAAQAAGTTTPLVTDVDGTPTVNTGMTLYNLMDALNMPGAITGISIVLIMVLVGIFFVTGADSASIIMGSISSYGVEEPRKPLIIFWGVMMGAVAAVMLLAGGDDPAEALTGLQQITIVAALPFVVVMVGMCIALTKDLDTMDVARLHSATLAVLKEWNARLKSDAFPEKVTAFREGMAVHGRYGKPCPVCGSLIQRIVYAENETNYCARCQTGGKILADRALSRLLKKSWPRTLEELE